MSTPAPVEAPTAAFAALGDENRFLILTVLSRYPAGASATTLAADMPVTRQAVSKHLQVLSHAGLVANHRHGREARYAAWLQDLGDQWERRRQDVKTIAEATTDPGAE
ncbi:metalloregulator ArsR/SmtB family transcription factor [soil metagenome]